jgi:antitoxin MazE
MPSGGHFAMATAITTRIIKIGNSRGVRIPKAVFDQVPLGDEVQLEVQDKQVVIRPAAMPRQGWDEQFRLMAKHGDDCLLDAHAGPQSSWDEEEWQW